MTAKRAKPKPRRNVAKPDYMARMCPVMLKHVQRKGYVGWPWPVEKRKPKGVRRK